MKLKKKEQSENEDIRMVRSSGLRQRPREFDFIN
jgi:hypothetical protein